MTGRHLVLSAMFIFAAIASISGCGQSAPMPAAGIHFVLTPEGAPLLMPSAHGAPYVLAVARDRTTGRFRRLAWKQPPSGKDGMRTEPLPLGEDSFLWAAGCLPLSLPAVPTRTPLRLQYGPRARLRLVTDDPPPAPPYEIHLDFTWRGPGDEPDALLRHSFRAAATENWFPFDITLNPAGATAFVGSDELVVRFSSAGPHRVSWTLNLVNRVTGGYTSTGFSTPDAGLSIDVKDGVEDQVIDITIPGAALRGAMQSLGK